jgi:hypothetical protein
MKAKLWYLDLSQYVFIAFHLELPALSLKNAHYYPDIYPCVIYISVLIE